jgi:hypothetical protein
VNRLSLARIRELGQTLLRARSGSRIVAAWSCGLAVAAILPASTAASTVHAKHAKCSAFLTAAQIESANGGFEVQLIVPSPVAEIGPWDSGPHTVCGGNFVSATHPYPSEPGSAAIWGVAYGLKPKNWRSIRSFERREPNEGTGPWTQIPTSVGRGYQAFDESTADSANFGYPTDIQNYLYVFTPHDDLFYLHVFPYTPAQLATLAGTILARHRSF